MAGDELLLLSGGLDSSALAVLRRPSHALTIDYGQTCAHAEISASRMICELLDIAHHTLVVDCTGVGGGLLAGERGPTEGSSIVEANGSAAEFWPFRNQLLVTFAAGIAYRLGVERVTLGCVSTDGDRHVDGSRDFVEAIAALTRMQEGEVDVSAPACELTTQELIEAAGVPLDLLGWTHSCHTANLACGWCPGCLKRELVLADVAPLS